MNMYSLVKKKMVFCVFMGWLILCCVMYYKVVVFDRDDGLFFNFYKKVKKSLLLKGSCDEEENVWIVKRILVR